MIFCVAAEVGCRYLISEHMQHGFTWRGLTIINPFSQEGDRTLCAVLDIER
jgi:predicted nucleic acid-binding protein